MEEEIYRPNDSTSESIEEMKIMVENYHNLLIKKEKELADIRRDLEIRDIVIGDMANEGELRGQKTISFLKKHFNDFQISLWFEACVRLTIVLILWVLVLIQSGFTWLTFLSLILTFAIYTGLEILVVHNNLRKAEESIYHR